MFKWKPKTQKAIRGSISILLVIILLPMMTFSAVIVDTSRINMAKTVMAGAGDLTMNTALANYDTILKDVYGLFAMSQEKTEEDLQKDLKEYFAKTISGYGVVSEAESGKYVESLLGSFNSLLAGTTEYENGHLSDLLKLEDLTVEADRVDNSSLASSAVLRNQIIEYMKFRAPMEFGMSFIDALKSFDVADEQMDVVETQVKAQEDTQDVTAACKALIDLIRQYDDLVKKNNAEVLGQSSSTDNKNVPLKDYATQVNKYLKDWGTMAAQENYTHINKIMLVFLAKSPSVDGVYLVKMDYPNGKFFIKNTGLDYTNCGINVSITKKGETSQAKQEVLNQISVVNGKKTIADKYKDKAFLKRNHMNNGFTAFTNDADAIDAFVGYEQFLKNKHSEVKYSEVETLLNEIYRLGKLYTHYDGKIADEIDDAYEDWQDAKAWVSRVEGNISRQKTNVKNNRTDINDLLDAYKNTDEELKVPCLSSHKTVQGTTIRLLKSTLPEITDYATYYDDNLKYGTTDKYYSQFRSIVNEVAKNGRGNDKKVAAAAKSYADNGITSNFASYIKKQTKETIEDTDPTTTELFKLLDCLLSCSKKAQAINNACLGYSQANTELAQANAEVKRTKGIYDNKVAEREDVKNQYISCINQFVQFGQAYQRDAYYYGKYIETATSIINRETAAIKSQFGAIVDNIDEQNKKLDDIVTQCGTVITKIDEYIVSVDAWEEEVLAYEKANGQDSFSKQARQDIATARSTYDSSSATALKEFVDLIRANYNEFYNYLAQDVYFKYGGKRLHEISNAEDAKTAAKSTIESIADEIITAQIAEDNLKYLYKSGPGIDFVPYTLEGTHYTQTQKDTGTADDNGQLCFLEPEVIFIKFLKYLNSAYPKTKADTKVTDKDGKETNVDAETDYNTTKEDLKTPDKSVDDMEPEAKTTTAETDKDSNKNEDKNEAQKPKTDRYGYSYKNVTISDTDKSNLPSKDTSGSSNSNSAFALKETDGKVNGSESVGDQKKAMNGVLGSLSSALTAGLENAYILTYIFENFSYNTMIQDAVMEGEKESLTSSDMGMATLTTAQGKLNDETVMEKYVDKQQTLSNYEKNAYNNYLYGAEVEYILYGSTSPETNVSYAKASIYAIRFAFNCIYAFTDSEIRNTTMAAGLAVQAATMGFVPYQVVQIVLQLALAAAESAVDLEMMMTGLDVAVIKTKDTWNLSISNAVKSAGALAAEAAKGVATKAIDTAAGGLQGVLDAGADKINDAVDDLKSDLNNTADQAVKDIADQIFGVMITDLEVLLNEMQYVEQYIIEEKFGNSVDSFGRYVDSKFTELETSLKTKLQQQFGGNELAGKVLDKILTKTTAEGKSIFNDLLDEVKTKVKKYAENCTPSQAVDKVIENINTVKMAMVNKVTDAVTRLTADLEGIAKDAVADVHTQLSDILAENAEELKQGVTTKVTQGITDATDKFVNQYLGDAVGTANSAGKVSGSASLASLLKFGYKEYLMLFVYIGICANGDSMLVRTADLIQLNLCNAESGATFSHNKGSAFRMKDACTYIHLTATAKLDMFFVDLGLFSSVMDPVGAGTEQESTGEVAVESDGTGTIIRYEGLLGY